jgi:hypothetical protein
MRLHNPVPGADADPQATVLTSLIGFDQTQTRAGIAFLLALIVEAGSAVGFAIRGAHEGVPPSASTRPSIATPTQHNPRRQASGLRTLEQ